MLCKVCSGCGLCEGNQKIKKPLIVTETVFPETFKVKGGTYGANEFGIAIDAGTTTVAAGAFSLKTGTFLEQVSALNVQRTFGTDVISRINFASCENGFERLSSSIKKQISDLVQLLVTKVKVLFLSRRIQNPVLSKIVICGNSAMISFLAGFSVADLGVYPFKLSSKFNFSVKGADFFGSSFEFPECNVYFPPAAGSFIGSDTFCSLVACDFFGRREKYGSFEFLVDAGTNCEMAAYDSVSKRLIVTSSAAGPAFEGQGIVCGMTASEGAVVSSYFDEKQCAIKCSVIGNTKAKGICGTGLLSTAALFLQKSIIDSKGTFTDEIEKYHLMDEVYIFQQDIRNLQVAKASVACGLKILAKEINALSCSEKKRPACLYLTGGFGSAFNLDDVKKIRLIPENLFENIIVKGNAALTGASMILLNDDLKENSAGMFENVQVLNLAEYSDFQKMFIEEMNF